MTRTGKQGLRIIPLGGLGEVGLNMMVFEQGDDLIVVDCGLMFPGDHLPGVDYVIPDFTYVREHADKLRGLVLTHGHEDHIGGVPFLLKEVNPPIYATPLTLGMVREKLDEHGLIKKAKLHEVKAGDTLELGSFGVELIRVSHSVADCLALAIRSSVGNLIHTGDFKLDPTPVDGQRVDLAAFARYGDKGVLALLSDSTNVEHEGYTRSEREVGDYFQDIFSQAPGRIIIAMFSSNIHRIQQALDTAALLNKKVAPMGRSMLENIRIGQSLGYLKIPPDVIVEPDRLRRLPDREAVIITTGTQGEPLSVLARLARDEHKQINIRPGDTVVLSSRVIPGNESAIHRLINEFYRRGAQVIYEKVSDVHVSGHASREELKLMIALTRPQYFIPVHGEYRHLIKHAELARSMDIPEQHILVVEDGDLVTFSEVGGEKMGRVEAGKQVVDGVIIADSEDAVIRERRRLAQDGVLVCVACIDKQSHKLIAPLRLVSNGLLFAEEAEGELETARLYAEAELNEMNLKTRSPGEISQAVKSALKRYMKKSLARFPVILPIVMEK